MDSLPGYTLGPLLGRGVYSEVFAGRHAAGGRFALKFLKPAYHADAWALQCFRREGVAGRGVRHPSLLPIIESRLTAAPFVHVMPAYEGRTLRDTPARPWPDVVSILVQVAGAMAALHRHGFVHGDVKPGNILITALPPLPKREGWKTTDLRRAILIDLGFARVPGTLPFDDGLPGTPNYLAPELCRRAALDTAAADIFALGITAYELLTGTLPYPKLDDSREVMDRHRDSPPSSLTLTKGRPFALVKLVNAMLSVNLFDRPKANRVVAELSALHVGGARKAA